MPSPRDLAIARARAANNSRQLTPRITAAPAKLPVAAKSAQSPPGQIHKYAERKTIALVVAFIGALVAAGIVYSYSSMSTGPPGKPVKETTLQAAPSAHIARILLPGTGSMCREILFDNDTGYFSLERPAPCDSAPPAQAKSNGDGGGGSGFSSFKEAFGRKS